MMDSLRSTLAGTLEVQPSCDGAELSVLPPDVDWLEVRADLVGELDPDWLRARFAGKLLYSLRSTAEGGRAPSAIADRRERLIHASRGYDLVDLEGARDLVPDVLAAIGPEGRVVSWRGPADELSTLTARFEKISSTPARLYRLVSTGERIDDALASLALLNRLGRADTIAYASGPLGLWTRLIAPLVGYPITFGGIQQIDSERGEPSVFRLIKDYGRPRLTPVKELFGILGSRAYHSRSPELHNAAYRDLGIPALFVPFPIDSFDAFWTRVVDADELRRIGISLNGLTIASPFKEEALLRASAISPMARRAGSTNVVIRSPSGWRAETTDSDGAVPLLQERRISIARQRAAVVGCGGSGRVVAASLQAAGADVTLVNRGLTRGRRAVELLGMPFVPLVDFSVNGYALIVNATPVGTEPGEMPFQVDRLEEHAAVVDHVCSATSTSLMAATRALGCVAIEGRDILLAQVRRQFQRMLGREMPLVPLTGLAGSDSFETAAVGLARD